MDKIYFIVENGAVSQPYSLMELQDKNLSQDTLVCKKFEDWKKAKDIPEVAALFNQNINTTFVAPQPAYSSVEEARVQNIPQVAKMESVSEPMIANNDEKISCPRCGSTNIHIDKKGFGGGKACCGAAMCGPIGLLLGNKGANKLRKTCLKCNNSWS